MMRRLTMMHQFMQKYADVVRIAMVPRLNQQNLGPIRIVEAPQGTALGTGCRAPPCLGLPSANEADTRQRITSGPVGFRVKPILEAGNQRVHIVLLAPLGRCYEVDDGFCLGQRRKKRGEGRGEHHSNTGAGHGTLRCVILRFCDPMLS